MEAVAAAMVVVVVVVAVVVVVVAAVFAVVVVMVVVAVVVMVVVILACAGAAHLHPARTTHGGRVHQQCNATTHVSGVDGITTHIAVVLSSPS